MKNLKFLATAILFLFLSVQTFAQLAESLLTRDLMAGSKTMKVDVNIYNYFTLQQLYSELRSEQGRESFVQRYISQRSGTFWDARFSDASPKNYAAGPGLYFAIDPSISQTYGNTFIEMTIPAGTKFINVVQPIPLKKDTLSALVTEGFLNPDGVKEVFPKQSGFYRDTLRVMVLPQYSQFRSLVQRIFNANSIQFVEYNFNAALSGFCAKHSYSAFNYVGVLNPRDLSNAIVPPFASHVKVYSANYNFPNQSPVELSSYARIAKYKYVLDQIIQLRAAGKPVKPFIAENYTPEELRTVKQKTFSCE